MFTPISATPTNKPSARPLDVLGGFLGIDPADAAETADAPLVLAGLRNARTNEAQDRFVRDVRAGDTRDAAGTDSLLKMLKGEADSDPYTGVAAHQREAATAATLGDASLRADPRMVADAKLHASQAGDLEQSIAHGKSLGAGTGAADAGVQPNAQFLERQQHQNKVEELAAPNLAKAEAATMGRGTIPGTNLPMPAKVSARADQTLQAIRELSPLIGQLEGTIADPHDNSLGDWVGNKFKYGLYKLGMSPDSIPGSTPQDQLRMQLAGLIKVLGASPYAASSRNFNFLKQAQEHLTDAGSTQAFMASQLKELRDILPRFQQEILVNEAQPGTELNFTEPGQPVYGGQPTAAGARPFDVNDPATWPRVQ